MLERVEPLRDFRLKAEAGEGEKRMSVGQTAVDRARRPRFQDTQGVRHGAVNAEMTTEAVAGTAGHEAEDRRRVDEARCDFVHRAVAADRHDQVAALGERASGELAGVTRSFGEHHGGAAVEGKFLDGGECARRAVGTQVDDETRFRGARVGAGRGGA